MEGDYYFNVCERLCTPQCSRDELNEVIDQFRSTINSERTIDKIYTMRDLLKILERRDVINKENLEEIARILKRSMPVNNRNMNRDYNCDFKFEHINGRRPPYRSNGQVLPPVSADVEERIFETICSEIGKHWKMLARHLAIPEGKIDELEWEYQKVEDIVREILVYNKQVSDRRYWNMNLCLALENSSRKDLSIKVNRIIASHSQ